MKTLTVSDKIWSSRARNPSYKEATVHVPLSESIDNLEVWDLNDEVRPPSVDISGEVDSNAAKDKMKVGHGVDRSKSDPLRRPQTIATTHEVDEQNGIDSPSTLSSITESSGSLKSKDLSPTKSSTYPVTQAEASQDHEKRIKKVSKTRSFNILSRTLDNWKRDRDTEADFSKVERLVQRKAEEYVRGKGSRKGGSLPIDEQPSSLPLRKVSTPVKVSSFTLPVSPRETTGVARSNSASSGVRHVIRKVSSSLGRRKTSQRKSRNKDIVSDGILASTSTGFQDATKDEDIAAMDSKKMINKREKKKKHKWFQRARAEGSIFSRLFPRANQGPSKFSPGAPVVVGVVGTPHIQPVPTMVKQLSNEGANSPSPVPSISQLDQQSPLSEVGQIFREVLDSNISTAAWNNSTPRGAGPAGASSQRKLSTDRSHFVLDLVVTSQRNTRKTSPMIIDSQGTDSQGRMTDSQGMSSQATDESGISSPVNSSQEEKIELVAAMLELIANKMMGKLPAKLSTEESKVAGRIDQLLGPPHRSRNSSGDSTVSAMSRNSLQPFDSGERSQSETALHNFQLGQAFRARGKRFKHQKDVSEECIKHLSKATTYSVFEQEMNCALNDRHGWRQISLLYFCTRQAIRRIRPASRVESYQMKRSEAKEWTVFEQRVAEIKHFSVFYFERKLAQWVQSQGGWQTVVEDTEDSELD